MLRRNSAISLGLFYDHIKQQLEDGSAEPPPAALSEGENGQQINGRAGLLRTRKNSISAPPQSLIQAYQQKKLLMQQQKQQLHQQHQMIEEGDSEDDSSDSDED